MRVQEGEAHLIETRLISIVSNPIRVVVVVVVIVIVVVFVKKS